MVAGPDLNGDGQAEVFVACAAENREEWETNMTWNASGYARDCYVHVAALSGSDGAILWHTTLPESFSAQGDLGPLLWWQPGADGRRQLVVSIANYFDGSETKAWALDQLTGRLRHSVSGLESIGAADFDGDGLPDLYGYRPKSFNPRGAVDIGKLHVFKATGPESVRKFGDWQVAGDFANEGRRALIQHDRAVSSRDGRELWHSPTLPKPDAKGKILPYLVQPVPDLNSDGVPDLLVHRSLPNNNDDHYVPLTVVSGKDGRVLWEVKDLTIRVGNWTWNGKPWPTPLSSCQFVGCRDLDGDGKSELIFVDRHQDAQGNTFPIRLLVLDGTTGRVKWQAPLTGAKQPSLDDLFTVFNRPEFADVDGQGVLTVFAPCLTDAGSVEIAAFDGRDGHERWRVPLGNFGGANSAFLPTMTVGRLTPDGPLELVVCSETTSDQMREERVQVLNAADGKERWSWRDPKTTVVGSTEDGLTRPVIADLDGNGKSSVCLLLR
jgi:outer membrane protein assembly factor BamB